jgi:hypothetical protein
VWKKKHQSEFAVLDTSDVLEWKKTFKKLSKSVQNRSEAFRSLKKAFWSGNHRSGVLFLLNLAKLIDFGFGVEISTIGSRYISWLKWGYRMGVNVGCSILFHYKRSTFGVHPFQDTSIYIHPLIPSGYLT